MHKIGMVLYPNFGATSFGALAAFELVNIRTQAETYEMTMVSQDGGPVRSSVGAEVVTTEIGDFAGDTLIVAGADRLQRYSVDLLASLENAPPNIAG